MSRCIVYPIHLSDHPTRSDLQIGRVGPYQVVVGRHYTERQLCFHLPEGAIVPDKLADEMWVLGKLGGNKKNRVRARVMDGVRSEGLFYGSQGASWRPEWSEGDDVTDIVGVTFGSIG